MKSPQRAQETVTVVSVLRIGPPLKYALTLLFPFLFQQLGLTQKTVAKMFEFPIHFTGASKVMKNKKKVHYRKGG